MPMQRLAPVLALAASLGTGPVLARDADDLRRIPYACDGGGTMEVVFLNTAGGRSYAFVLMDGEMIVMQAAVSASGARYLSVGGPPTFQFWEAKGRADLVALEGDDEVPLRQDCRSSG